MQLRAPTAHGSSCRASQSRTVLSLLPVAKSRPSGKSATHITRLVCPVRPAKLGDGDDNAHDREDSGHERDPGQRYRLAAIGGLEDDAS